MMTIVVTGTHAVGKTSLCNRLVEVLSNKVDVKMIPETARILMARGIPLNDNASEHAIVSYLYEYLRRTRESEASLVISDRSVFDLYAYISVSRAAGVRDEFLKLAEEVVRQEVERVHAYIYVPIESELQVDDVRPADVLYQKAVDDRIRNLLKFFGARVVPVHGTLDERVAQVMQFLNDNITKT
jgi:thymidylate kinase